MDHDDLMALGQQIVRAQAGRAGLDAHAIDDLTQEVLFKYLRA